ARVPRHAAALSRISCILPGAERAVLIWGSCPGRRLHPPADLPDLVAVVRPARRSESVGRQGSGMDHVVPTTQAQLPSDPHRGFRTLRLSEHHAGGLTCPPSASSWRCILKLPSSS